MARPLALRSPANAKSADVWLGGDVKLGDGGRGPFEGIAGMVQGSIGIVNLEGARWPARGVRCGFRALETVTAIKVPPPVK